MAIVVWFTSDFSIEVVARRWRRELDVRRLRLRALRPRFKGFAQLGFHLLGIEVAANTEDDVVGLDIFVVPVQPGPGALTAATVVYSGTRA